MEFNRINNYLRAIEEGTVKEYHRKRGRGTMGHYVIINNVNGDIIDGREKLSDAKQYCYSINKKFKTSQEIIEKGVHYLYDRHKIPDLYMHRIRKEKGKNPLTKEEMDDGLGKLFG